MKILVWNIKFFSKNRIVGQTATGYSTVENASRTKNDAARALQSLTYIRSTVSRTDPDIFVVVEPRASAGTPGTLADSDSGGPAGLILLLAHLRATLSATWCLVPPLRINSTRTDPIDKGSQYTECIGVFWRSDRLTFTGPWQNTASGARPAGVLPAIVYAPPWDAVVPALTTFAGQCLFQDQTKNEPAFVGFPLPTSRLPFRTTFTEIGGTARLIDLYSLHLDTHEGALAATALLKLPFSETHNKLTVIAGDFNVDISGMTTMEGTAMNSLDEFFVQLYPGPATYVLGKGNRYPPTIVKSGPEADPGSYAKKATYDYGLVHYSAGAVPVGQTCQVIDRVAGTPDFVGRGMSYALKDFTRPEDPIPLDIFRNRVNYAKIGTPAVLASSPAVLADGTSDHLPILVTV